MKFTLEINMDNDIFQGGPERELKRLLEKAGQQIEEGQIFGKLLDINGNSVGSFGIII